MEPNHVWEILSVVAQCFIAIVGFIGALMINRLIKSIDALTEADAAIWEKLNLYREDMLRNYVRNEQLEPMKKDILGRVDRMELSFKEALMAHEHRELRMFQMMTPNNGG